MEHVIESDLWSLPLTILLTEHTKDHMLVITFAAVIVIIVHVYILGYDPGQLGLFYHYPSDHEVSPLVPALSVRSYGMSFPVMLLLPHPLKP